MLGGENTNSIERELANTIDGSVSHNDTEAFSYPKGISSLGIEVRDKNDGNEIL